MADVLGVASAVAQLLEGGIRLLKRIRKAHERHQNLTRTLDKHVREIDSINFIVGAIVDEEALQTAAVAVELTKLCDIGTRLIKCIGGLDPGDKGTMRQLAHQFVRGTKDQETLADIMADLDRGKADLSLRVQLANVGLTSMLHGTVLANAKVIDRMDRLLSELFGEHQGLKLAGLLKNMRLQETDYNLVEVKKVDIVSLSQEMSGRIDLDDTLSDGTMDRIIVGNTALDSAVQLLGPVGKDLWEDIRVRVENNTASGNAAQFAYPTDFASFKYLLDRQERMAAIGPR